MYKIFSKIWIDSRKFEEDFWQMFTVIEGQLMLCKQILSDYRWAMVIQAHLKGIVQGNEAQATNQRLSYPVSSRSCTCRYWSGWNPKLEISLWDTSKMTRWGMWLKHTKSSSNEKNCMKLQNKSFNHYMSIHYSAGKVTGL